MEWPDDQLEALHACYMIEVMFEGHVLDASFVKDSENLSDIANKVHEAIADMYQAIGGVENYGETAHGKSQE